MSNIEFKYNDKIICIQGKEEEKMKTIIDRFLNKGNGIKDNLIFLYDGNKIDEEKTLSQQANKIDKLNKKMSIIAIDFNEVNKDIKNLKKSKNIICPECNENIRIRIYGQKIFLYECKNKHKKNDLLLTQFEKTQYIDESKIICNACKNNKNDVYGNKFYICVNCKFKLCPLCKNSHDKSHNIIDYDEKNYICATHFESYTSYCYDCKKDICTMCEKEHSSHKSITYGSILPDMEKVNNELKNLNQKINEYKNEINKIIEKLKNNLINLDIYYKIAYDIINNYENKKRNYPILQNINDINDFIKNINKTIRENKIVDKINNIISLFYKNIEEQSDKEKERNEKEEVREKDNDNEKEITKIKEEKNSENIKEEENEIEEIQKYNPLDDKFEKFKVSKLRETKKFKTSKIEELIILQDQKILFSQKFYDKDENTKYTFFVYDTNKKFKCDFSLETNSLDNMFQIEIKKYTTKYKIEKFIILQDQRILCLQNFDDKDEKSKYIFFVYDTNNNFKCDFSLETNFVENMIQMNDGNIIIYDSSSEKQIKVVKVKKKCFEIIEDFKDNSFYIYDIFKISEEIVGITTCKCIKFYSYNKGKLISIDREENIDSICDLCYINNSEIAIYYYKDGKLFGFNAFLLFYDIIYYKKNKTLKLGDRAWGKHIKLVNENTLILERNSKIVIIDAKNRIVKKEIKFEYYKRSIILLNENNFLIESDNRIYQCEIINFHFALKEKKDINFDFIDKYPGNKLIISKDKEICIYEMKEIHYHIKCVGCQMNPLIGIRYKCEECQNFDYCESCYDKNKESHGHTFNIIKEA